jgi:hypothetical protein
VEKFKIRKFGKKNYKIVFQNQVYKNFEHLIAEFKFNLLYKQDIAIFVLDLVYTRKRKLVFLFRFNLFWVISRKHLRRIMWL